MDDRKWEELSEGEFEAMLGAGLPDLPPEGIVEEVTPWKRAWNRVLVGMALSTVTLNFWLLDTILPAVGVVLMLLGFRSLRRENRWFRSCFVLTLLRAVHFFLLLLLNTTIWVSAGVLSALLVPLKWASLLLLLAVYVCLWQGLRAVREKAGLPPRAGAAGGLVIWYLLMCVLGVVEYGGLILVAALLAVYFLILRSLFRCSRELDEAGYGIQSAPVRIPDGWVVKGLVLLVLIGGACGYLFGNRYPMDWRPVEETAQAGLEDVRAKLLTLGFPEEVLNDLAPEDLEACRDGVEVVVDVTGETFSEDGRGPEELRVTGVGVRLAGERERWVLIHHFLWTEDPGFYGTESVQLWPVYRDIPEGWIKAGEVTGRVLYSRDGREYAAPYFSLGEQTFTSDSVFWGEQQSPYIFAAFSFPADGGLSRLSRGGAPGRLSHQQLGELHPPAQLAPVPCGDRHGEADDQRMEPGGSISDGPGRAPVPPPGRRGGAVRLSIQRPCGHQEGPHGLRCVQKRRASEAGPFGSKGIFHKKAEKQFGIQKKREKQWRSSCNISFK